METFNADNTFCPWDGTAFQGGEEGMKCSSCGAVMKLESWQEKQSCRSCSGCQAVRVRAVSSSGRTSARRMGTRLNPSSGVRFGSRTTLNRQENISSNNPPRNTQPPIVSPRNQNQGIGVSSSGSSSGTPTRNSSTSSLNSRPITNNPPGWLIGAGSILVMLILSAIALPSFFNQANKAKQSEAKQYVASMNKGQEAVFAEKASFSTNIPDLGLGIKSETENYKYQIPQRSNNSVVVAVAEPKKSGLKGYVGIVASVKKDSTETLFCEESQASTSFPDLSTIVNQKSPSNNVVQCPAGYQAQEGKPQFINLGSSPNPSPKEEVRSQTNSPTPSVSEERVNFDKGSTQKTISSSLVTNQTKRYSINCGSGQPMTVQIKQGDINVTIISPNGQAIGNAVKAGSQWNGQLPSDGDYIIEVSAPNQSNYVINIEVLPSKIPVSSTPEQTLKSFYELTTKDNKAAGKAFTTEEFKKKNNPKQTDPQKTWVSTFNFIEVTQIETIEKSPTRAKMKVWLRYFFKDSRPEACEYRDCTLVLKNNRFLIDDISEYTPTSCP
jgi:type II secretory pathway pseudopilin PulG